MAGVGGDPVVQKIRQPRLGAGLAGGPGLAQPACPIGLGGEQAEGLERHALGSLAWPFRRHELARGGSGLAGIGQGEAGAPVGGEDPVEIAHLGADRPGLEQKLTIEALDPQAIGCQRRLYGRVDRNGRGLIAPRPEGAGGASSPRHRRHNLARASLENVEAPADGGQGFVQSRQTVMQPPARRAAKGANTCAFLIKDIDAEHWSAAGHRRGKSRLIGEPQVIPQPDKGGTALRIRFRHQNQPPSRLHVTFGLRYRRGCGSRVDAGPLSSSIPLEKRGGGAWARSLDRIVSNSACSG